MSKEKFYCLDMFPYPSGSGLHVGHIEGYTATDILSRYQRMNGFNVIHPMGWDSFGLPAENYAIKTGIHPRETTDKSINVFKRQLDSLKMDYDWEREIKTSSPEYYKWTQWLFLLLYKKGLAYKKKAKVNWCDNCSTVLANEQAEGGICERCGEVVVQKDLEQWFFKITDFIEDQEFEGREIKGLLSGLDGLDWPSTTKQAQVNWIGKSVGAELGFKINSSEKEYSINVFTTRPETLFGCTYLAISPEHELIKVFSEQIENLTEINAYLEESRKKTEMERLVAAKDKNGVALKGLTVINPVNNKEVKIFVVDYVLSSYGSGAIMAVPAHDERDYDFAKKYNLELVEVVSGGDISREAYLGDGLMINSDFLNGLSVFEARNKMIEYLVENKIGKASTNYRLRDWLISRQRYWGAPIPIIYCPSCGELPVSKKDLPVVLPDDVDFLPSGESPLRHSKLFHDVSCPLCGAAAHRESDTMDTFVCSSWYYFRYLDPQNKDVFCRQELMDKYLPVDLYIGGDDHSVMHLLYARFITKVLQKYNYTKINEPFIKLRHQGMILSSDGSKMSKSKGNVVSPDEIIKEYGADTLRLYEMFMGPLEDSKPWNTKNILGVKRFLEKIELISDKIGDLNDEKVNLELSKTIKKVGEDIEALKFNTAISQLMIFVNFIYKLPLISRDVFKDFLLILYPFAPFLVESLWEKNFSGLSLIEQSWPKYKSADLLKEKIKLIIQINGKTRGVLELERDLEQEVVIEIIKKDDKFKKYLENDYKKIIYLPNKLINFII